jgi:predicted DNA-binding transcriptional regulator YafY
MPSYRPNVRADRLLSLMLLLQARGRMTAATLAAELEVSVRTIYRDIEALGAAGVPVYAEAGPGGGCQLLDGYRSPLSGLSADEAAALLVLGVPDPIRQVGFGAAASAAQRHIRSAAGLPDTRPTTLLHLDLPRWFHGAEAVPHLACVADGVRRARRVALRYRRADGHQGPERVVHPLGIVNKSGTWYLVATTPSGRTAVFRVGRIVSARLLDDPAERPDDFDLAAFWDGWSAEFRASRPQLPVTVRASAEGLSALPEIFGDGARAAVAAAGPPDADGRRDVTLAFEHEAAAGYRLAGLGDLVEVVSPPAVRDRVIAVATATLRRHGQAPTFAPAPPRGTVEG